MSKNKKRSSSQNVNNVVYEAYGQAYPVPVPEVLNTDELAVMADDEIFGRLSHLEADRISVIDARFDPTPWEIEIAWMRRELHVRRARRELHEQYLQTAPRHEEFEFVEYEDYSQAFN